MIDKETGEIMVPFMRTPFNYDTDRASDETALRCDDPTRAQQQFKQETDINTIVERFGLTGELPKDLRVPTHDEFWQVQDYQGALNKINEAREAFMEMPAAIRAEFDNDPGRFVDFVSDEKNRERAKSLGILQPEKKEEPAQPLLVKIAPEEPTP